jgi:hypothetical protein
MTITDRKARTNIKAMLHSDFGLFCRVVCRVVVGPIIHDRVQCDEVCEIADPFENSNFDTAVKSGVDYAITIGTPRGTPAVLDDVISARIIANDLDSMLQIILD